MTNSMNDEHSMLSALQRLVQATDATIFSLPDIERKFRLTVVDLHVEGRDPSIVIARWDNLSEAAENFRTALLTALSDLNAIEWQFHDLANHDNVTLLNRLRDHLEAKQSALDEFRSAVLMPYELAQARRPRAAA